MTAERIGLIAQLDIGEFTKNYRTYVDSIQKMNAETLKTVNGLNATFTQFGSGIRTATNMATPGIQSVTVASKEMRTALANAIPVSEQLKQQLQQQRTAYGILSAEIDEMRQKQGQNSVASEKQALTLQKVESRLQEQRRAYDMAGEELRQLVEKQNASSVASQQQVLRLRRLDTTLVSLRSRYNFLSEEIAIMREAGDKGSLTLQKKEAALKILARRIEEADKGYKLLVRQIKETTEQHDKGTGAVNKKVLAVEKLRAKLDEQEKAYDILSRQIAENTQREETASVAVQKKMLALQKLDAAIKQTEIALRKSSETTQRNTTATRAFDSALDLAEKAARSLANSLLSLGIGFASKLASMGSAIATNLVTGFKNAAVASLEFGNYLNNQLYTAIKRVGLAAGMAVIAMVAMGKDPVSAAADVEAQISRVQSILQLTKQEAEFLNDVVMELGIDPKLVVTTKEAADVLEMLAKNGIFVGMSLNEMEEAALNAGRAVVYLANSTDADFAQAADIATDVMLMFNKEAKDMEEIVAGIIGVTVNSKFTINDYELALRNGGAAAASFGVALEDFNTIIALTAEETGRGRRAGTGFANVMYRLVPISDKAAERMRELGIITAEGANRFFDAEGNMQDFSEVVKVLNETFIQTRTVMQEVSYLTPQQQSLLADLKVEYANAEKVIYEYTNGVKSLTTSEEVRNKKIAEAQAIIESITPKMQELSAIESDWVETVIEMSDAREIEAIRTIFGRDALASVIGLMKEGAPIVEQFADRGEAVAEVINMIGVSQEEANKMLDEGITYFELMNIRLSQIDPEEMAKIRMDNFRGAIEKVSSVIETLWIKIGTQLLPILTELALKFLDWLSANKELQAWLEGVAAGVAGFIEAIASGQGIFDSFIAGFDSFSDAMRDVLQALYLDEYESKLELAQESGKDFAKDLGKDGLSAANQRLKEIGDNLRGVRDRLLEAKQNFDKFMDPILTFVSKHGPAINTALKNMGKFIGGLMVASGVAKVLGLLFNPVARLIAIVGILGTAWEENWGGIQDKVNDVKDAVGKLLDELGILDAYEAGGIQQVFAELPQTISTLSEIVKNTEIDWSGIYDGILETSGELGTKFGELFNDVDWEQVITILGDFLIANIKFLGAVGETFITFWTNFFSTVDWSETGEEIMRGIGNVLTSLGETWDNFVNSSFVENLKTKISEFITETDWLQLGVDIVVGIVKGLWTFWHEAHRVVFGENGWFSVFLTWLEETNWFDLGVQAVLGTIEGIAEFYVLVWTTLETWGQAFQDWKDSIDWTQLGYDIVTFVLNGLADFNDKIAETLAKWYTSITDWWEKPERWKYLATYVIDSIKERWEKFWDDVSPTLVQLYEDIKKWWFEIDWAELGANIIDGVILGIAGRLEAAKAAILGIAEGVSQAWYDFWESRSPSRKMFDSAKDIMQGANLGFKDSVPAVSQTLENAATSLFSSFLNRTNDILPFSGNSNPVQNVNNTSTRNVTLNNNFTGNPQITDANQLELLLAGY